jgi:hypothetical protein
MNIWQRIFGSSTPNSGDAFLGFHHRIIETATRKLGRGLTPAEMYFITRRGSFIALEMIEDTVGAADPAEIVRYLNSENHL